jgi:hypothetical protein
MMGDVVCGARTSLWFSSFSRLSRLGHGRLPAGICWPQLAIVVTADLLAKPESAGAAVRGLVDPAGGARNARAAPGFPS